MQLSTLKNQSLESILAVFNESFSDYSVPLQMTLEQLRTKFIADKVNLDYSVGAFSEGNLVGFVLHGENLIDGDKVLYNGGTGVIPSARGQKLTQKMYQFILPKLKAEGVAYLKLEVISDNTPAIRSYENTGFKIVRKLNCYQGTLNAKAGTFTYDTHELKDLNWKYLQTFWDFKPTAQNSITTISKTLDQVKSICAFDKETQIGYVIVNPISRRIQQIAVDKNYRRRGVATGLMARVVEEFGTDFKVINVDAGSVAANAFFKSVGQELFLVQNDMRMEIKSA